MKRVGNLFEKFISDQNIAEAIIEVNRTHRTKYGKKNKTVAWVENTMFERVAELKQIILDGFVPTPFKSRVIYDESAQKERTIYEPKLYPDQYIHHMLIQALQPVLMRGMDHWCCASIKGRGIIYGMKGIKRWLKNDVRNTKYCAELDIYHFYESLQPQIVMRRLKKLIKDQKMLDFIGILIKNGITIGAYYSQWFANTVLQELDIFIRQKLKIKRYLRYMDNLTLFHSDKKQLHRYVRDIIKFLCGYKLKLKSNWQIYPVDKRLVNALGYRYGRNFSIIRKRSLFKLKKYMGTYRKLKRKGKKIEFKLAAGLISRYGALKWCNSWKIKHSIITEEIVKELKRIVSCHRKRLNKLIAA